MRAARCVVLPPGAAHMSSTRWSGRTSSTWPQTTDGRFCRKPRCSPQRSSASRSPRLGQSRTRCVISTATPLPISRRPNETFGSTSISFQWTERNAIGTLTWSASMNNHSQNFDTNQTKPAERVFSSKTVRTNIFLYGNTWKYVDKKWSPHTS